MKRVSNKILFFVLLLFISSCGGGGGGFAEKGSGVDIGSGGGGLELVVKNAKSFNPSISHGMILNYRVTITADDLENPIVVNFDGSSTEGVINDVPAGENRSILVEAVNPNGAVIREGETEGVEVKGGEVADAEVSLEPVPIFTNLSDGNSLANTRLIFKVFAEPGSQIIVEELLNENQSPLLDASTLLPDVSLDQSTGLGFLSPSLQFCGEHTYIVRDLNTNRSSSVKVDLTDGAKGRAAPLFAAGGMMEPDLQGRVSCGTY